MAIFVKLNGSDVKSLQYGGATQYSDIGWGFKISSKERRDYGVRFLWIKYRMARFSFCWTNAY